MEDERPWQMKRIVEESHSAAARRRLVPHYFGNDFPAAEPIRHKHVSAGGLPLNVYFGLVKIDSLGSSTILCVPAGTAMWNEDSSPSANTRPSKTCFPVITA